MHLLPSDEATVTPRGIRFRGDFYTCEKAEEENWRFIARNKGTWKENIAYDPRVPEIIYLRLQDGSPSIPCYLINPDSIVANSDLAEIEEYYERKKIGDQIAEVEDMQAHINLDIKVDDIVSEAEGMAAATIQENSLPESKAALIKGMSERKRDEIAQMDEEYRRDILEGEGIVNITDTHLPSPSTTELQDQEYIPRPRLANVLSIQERILRDYAQEK